MREKTTQSYRVTGAGFNRDGSFRGGAHAAPHKDKRNLSESARRRMDRSHIMRYHNSHGPVAQLDRAAPS